MSRNLSSTTVRVQTMTPASVSALTLALALAWPGGDAQALGLGGLRVKSALNQPFVGEIDLLDVKPDELDAVKAQLAPAGEFSKAGAERYHYLTRLRFSPQISPRGDTVIRVSSREPIREPYMDLLVEVVWPKGRLVREFTILLDPPVTDARPAPRVEPPVARSRPAADAPAEAPAKPQKPKARVAADHAAEESPAPAPRGQATGGFPKRIGPVRRGTGLWRLAVQNSPQGATAAQTAMALYRNNQGAFIAGDINRLMLGKTLTIPNTAELFALSPEAAQREFQSALAGRKVRRKPIADPTLPSPAEESGESRLKIAGTAPETKAPGVAPVAPGTDAGAAPAPAPGMEEELLLVREASESTRQETVELRGRIRDLESQLGEIQRLLQLRNAELARIQSGATAAPGATAPAVAAGSGSEPLVSEPLPLPADLEKALAAAGGLPPTEGAAPTAEDGATEPRPAGDSTSPVAATTPSPGPGETVPPMAAPGTALPSEPAQVPVSPKQARQIAEASAPGAPSGEAAGTPPTPSIADAEDSSDEGVDSTWRDVLVPLAGLAGVTALGMGALGWARARRRRLAGEAEDLDSTDLSDEPSGAQARTAAAIGRGAGTQGAVKADDSETSAHRDASPSSDFASLGHSGSEIDEGDVISEADIYIAYGRYREAEDLLRDEMRRHPDRIDIKFKLAEAFFGAKNHQGLRDLMEEMRGAGYQRVNPEQWQRLEDMAAAAQSSEAAESSTAPTLVRASESRGAAARVAGLPGAGYSESNDVLSLDISDAKLPADLKAAALRRDRSDRPAAGRPGASRREASARLDTSTLDDASPLVSDDDVFAPAFGLDSQSDGVELDLPSSGVPGRDFADGVSDLELTIDDLRSASDLDLDTFVDSTNLAGVGRDDPGMARRDRPSSPVARTQGQPGGDAAAVRPAPPALAGAGLEESASSDPLSSQWQMDSGLWDETATKLDLARAYLEMGDKESARGIIEEVVAEGNDEQRRDAQALLRGLD